MRSGTRSPDASAKRGLTAVSGRFFAVAIGAIAGVIAARTIGPADWGVYAVVVAVVTTTSTLGQLSIHVAHISLWSEVENKAALAANALVIGLVCGGFAAVAAWAFVVGRGSTVVPESAHGLFAVALVLVPLLVVLAFSNNLLFLHDRIGSVTLGFVIAAAVQAILVVTLATTGRLTIRWVLIAWSATVAIPLAVALVALRPRLRMFDRRLAFRTARTGMRYQFWIASQFLLFRSDVLLLSLMTNQRSVGLYAVAVSVGEMIFLACSVLAQLALPKQVVGTKQARAEMTARVVRLNALCAVLVTGVLVAVGPFAIPLVYGDAYTASVAPFAALLPGIMALAALNSVSPYMVGLEHPFIIAAMTFAALTVNVIANLLLIPHLGATGAAISSSVAYGVLAIAELTWFSRDSAIGWRDLLPGRDDIRQIRVDLRRLVTRTADPLPSP